MKAFWKKKKNLQEEMAETFNVYLFERERLHAEQIQLALELARKRQLRDYVR